MMVSMKQVVSVATLPVHMGDRPKRKVQGIRNQTLPPPPLNVTATIPAWPYYKKLLNLKYLKLFS